MFKQRKDPVENQGFELSRPTIFFQTKQQYMLYILCILSNQIHSHMKNMIPFKYMLLGPNGRKAMGVYVSSYYFICQM